VLGPVLVFGLLAWIAMNLPASLLVGYLGIASVIGVFWLGADTFDLSVGAGYHRTGRVVLDEMLSFFVWFAGLAPAVMLAAELAVLGGLGWIRKRSAALCAGLWLAIALALYPFMWALRPEAAHLAAVYCAGFAALAVLGWPERILSAAGGFRAALRRENREQHDRRKTTVAAPRRVICVAALIAAMAFVAWLRWPAQSRFAESLHAQGLPATLDEENTWYKAVPDAENLAVRYQDAVEFEHKLEHAWNKQADDNPALQQAIKETGAKDALGNVLVQGMAQVKRAEPIPPAVWTTTRDYAAAVADPVTAKLDEAAKSGLHESRYPVDLRRGPEMCLTYLAKLRVLAREGSVASWVAAMEGRPEDAATAILDLIPLANSLSEEPILISQLVRIAILGISVSAVETAMNRAELPEAVMARLQDGLKHALPPLEEGPFLSRSIVGEEVYGLNAQYDWGDTEAYETEYRGRAAHTRVRGADEILQGITARMGSDLVGMRKTERMLMARMYSQLRENALEAAQTGRLPKVEHFESTLEALSYHAPMAYILMPALGRSYEAEWRIRTQLDMARTALAVERFRLTNGRLPKGLAELAPAFLDLVPNDPWNDGKPLSYRVKENGEFVVYSFGRNKTDQKGEEVKDNWWTNGDVTFTVAPVEARVGTMDN
jgi:hypothetical protein